MTTEADHNGFYHIIHDKQNIFDSRTFNRRIKVSQTLDLILPAGHNFAQLNTCLRILNGDGSTDEIPFERNALGGGRCRWRPRCSGPSELCLSAQAFPQTSSSEASSPSPMLSAAAQIVVEPQLMLSETQSICPESLCICTCISQRLGPCSRWKEVLLYVAEQGYNAVHLTPVQVLGESRSSYSVADFLTVSSDLARDWQELSGVVSGIHKEAKLLFFADLVLNHTANTNAWLKVHPDAGYNQLNSPWLIGAIELDEAIKNFNREVCDGKWTQRYGARPHLHNDNDLNSLMRAFRSECLDPFKVQDYFWIDIEQCCNRLGRSVSEGQRGRPEDIAWTEALKQVGTTRKGIVLTETILNQIARSSNDLRRCLSSINKRLSQKAEETYRGILSSIEGAVRYERLECRKGAINCSPWNSLVPWYFTPVECKDGRILHLANNGWVMGWDVSKDFAGPGALVYLERSLVAWSDCVKLRYGSCPEESPALWDMMGSYCEKSAEVFHGVRLDNCHSTPLAVGKYMLQRARKVRPNLFVFAELFTGSADLDLVFERELGLDALVREAVQTSSPGDLAWHTMKFARKRLGDLPAFTQDFPRHYFVGDLQPLAERKAISLFYDCTHDNETPVQKGRILDALACSAIVCASPYSVGSTLGYEVLMQTNPSVIADGRKYLSWSKSPQPRSSENVKSDESSISFENESASSVELWGSFNNWCGGIKMRKVKANQWTTSILPEWKDMNSFTFKFVIDASWCCSPNYAVQTDSNGNSNNVWRSQKAEEATLTVQKSIDCGIADGKHVLNRLHQTMADSGFEEVAVQWICEDMHLIERHHPSTGEAYYFFVRSAWWPNVSDSPSNKHCRVHGRIDGTILCHKMVLNKPQWNEKRDEKHVLGVCGDASCMESIPAPKQWYQQDCDATNLIFDYMPAGAVYIVHAQIRRPQSSLIAHFKGLDLSSLSLEAVNFVLWSCEREEQDRSKGSRGVYQFPEMENIVFAGVNGVCHALSLARQTPTDHQQQHPFYQNVMKGDWLLDYHRDRMQALQTPFSSWFVEGLALIKATPHSSLKPMAVDYFFAHLHEQIVQYTLVKMNLARCHEDILAQQLAIASTQLLGMVPSSSLDDRKVTATMSAGLPHFSVEYMREWGRDTFAAICGLMFATGRWEEAEKEIMGFARVLRHAMIPNLLDSANNPRYNARDAVWYWLYAIRIFVQKAPEGHKLLGKPLETKYQQSLEYEVPQIETLSDAIHVVMSCHYRGIKYREWNAGTRIDSQMKDEGFNINVWCDTRTGFCHGGNRYNCGTWMDKMGSSDKAGNKGFPATPRDGAPVELTAILWATLKWITEDLTVHGLFSHKCTASLGGKQGIAYSDWFQLVDANFSKMYRITESDAQKHDQVAVKFTYKDTFGCSVEEEDFYLRCNFSIGLAMAEGIVPSSEAVQALEICYDRLMNEPNQVGMKTLDPRNYKYRANYDNANDGYDRDVAHGFNYHNGPEWVWPYGYWLTARYLYGDKCAQDVYQIVRRLHNVRAWTCRRPWWSLPELMDNNGRVCNDSCQTQAWSVGSILWFLWLAGQDGEERIWKHNEKQSISLDAEEGHNGEEGLLTRAPASPLTQSS